MDKKNKHLKIELTPDEDLNLSIARASWVVGCNTFAMVVALKANINGIFFTYIWARM